MAAAATSYSVAAGESLLSDWTALFGSLFLRLRDGYTITADPDDTACGCKVASAPYKGDFYDDVVADTGDKLKVPPEEAKSPATKWTAKPKTMLKALR